MIARLTLDGAVLRVDVDLSDPTDRRWSAMSNRVVHRRLLPPWRLETGHLLRRRVRRRLAAPQSTRGPTAARSGEIRRNRRTHGSSGVIPPPASLPRRRDRAGPCRSADSSRRHDIVGQEAGEVDERSRRAHRPRSRPARRRSRRRRSGSAVRRDPRLDDGWRRGSADDVHKPSRGLRRIRQIRPAVGPGDDRRLGSARCHDAARVRSSSRRRRIRYGAITTCRSRRPMGARSRASLSIEPSKGERPTPCAIAAAIG